MLFYELILFIFHILFVMFVNVWVCAYHGTRVQVRGQLSCVASFSPSYGYQGSNLGHHVG